MDGLAGPRDLDPEALIVPAQGQLARDEAEVFFKEWEIIRESLLAQRIFLRKN